ncbi:MAG: hypothetical protein EZS28_003074 [Streblomastix strix]|uniref:Uncharacterized protein n=1 Tax=Streblomastix strix TaxID=222440 RepID=A0A5J4X225_9EUKA|nr:MAG: hypothetical protein EZS28_003074 [Streblomastix strix]
MASETLRLSLPSKNREIFEPESAQSLAIIEDHIRVFLCGNIDDKRIALINLLNTASRQLWSTFPAETGRLLLILVDLFSSGTSEDRQLCSQSVALIKNQIVNKGDLSSAKEMVTNLRVIAVHEDKELSNAAIQALCQLVEKGALFTANQNTANLNRKYLIQSEQNASSQPNSQQIQTPQPLNESQSSSNLTSSSSSRNKIHSAFRIVTSIITSGQGQLIPSNLYYVLVEYINDEDDFVSAAANNFIYLWKRKKLDIPKREEQKKDQGNQKERQENEQNQEKVTQNRKDQQN